MKIDRDFLDFLMFERKHLPMNGKLRCQLVVKEKILLLLMKKMLNETFRSS